MTDLTIYPNQNEAARNIIRGFLSKDPYQILGAEPQAGKTGACRAVVKMIKATYPDIIVYLICGMNYLNLKCQEIQEFNGLIPEQNILFSKDLEYFRNIQGTCVQLDKTNKCRRLFIIDESHFAQNAKNNPKKVIKKDKMGNEQFEFEETLPSLVHRFFQHYAGLTLDGDKSKWVPGADQTLILSVSATPMSEVAHFDSPLNIKCSKQITRLKPADTYYGFERMLELERARQSFNLTNKVDQTKFVQILHRHLQQQQSQKHYKYALIRWLNNKVGKAAQAEFRKKLVGMDVRIINFHSQEMNIRDINDIVGERPYQFTLIHIFHSLRAGVQVNTENICLVHEMKSSGPDVTAQGLPGRCCGYNKEHHGAIIYCNLKSLKKYVRWVQHDFDPKYIPPSSRNIKKSLQNDRQCPFEANKVKGIKMSDHLLKLIEAFKENNPKSYKKFWNKFGFQIKQELSEKTDIDPEYWVDYRLWGQMILKDNKESTWKAWWTPTMKAYQTGNTSTAFYGQSVNKMSKKMKKLYEENDKFFYLYINITKTHPDYGYLLMPSKVKSDPMDRHVLTTGKEQFHPDNNPDLNDLPISYMVETDMKDCVASKRFGDTQVTYHASILPPFTKTHKIRISLKKKPELHLKINNKPKLTLKKSSTKNPPNIKLKSKN